jgi:hypothetical protein
MQWQQKRPVLWARLSPDARLALAEYDELASSAAAEMIGVPDVVQDFEAAVGGLCVGPIRLGIAAARGAYPEALPEDVICTQIADSLEPSARSAWFAGIDEYNGAREYLYLDDRGRVIADQDLEPVRCVAPSWVGYLERRLRELRVPHVAVAMARAHLGDRLAAALGTAPVEAANSAYAAVWERTVAPHVTIFDYGPDDVCCGTWVHVDRVELLVQAVVELHRLAPEAELNAWGSQVVREWIRDDLAAWDDIPAGTRLVLSAPFALTTMHKRARLRIFEREGTYAFRVVELWSHQLPGGGQDRTPRPGG